MYLLDTNVISELRKIPKSTADKNVMAWAKSVDSTLMFMSTITIFEIELGIQLHRQKDATQSLMLHDWFHGHVMPLFAGRVLPVNEIIALTAAELNCPNRRPLNDSLILATGKVHQLIIVTRNEKDFEGAGIKVLNPWGSEQS